uniref:Uncharacterized protein n=1 Tax=Populus trichocarpa TaxID=3694 RepID=U5G7K7_POPTR
MNELRFGLVGLHQGLLKKVHLFLSMLMNAQISITCHCDINHTLVSITLLVPCKNFLMGEGHLFYTHKYTS